LQEWRMKLSSSACFLECLQVKSWVEILHLTSVHGMVPDQPRTVGKTGFQGYSNRMTSISRRKPCTMGATSGVKRKTPAEAHRTLGFSLVGDGTSNAHTKVMTDKAKLYGEAQRSARVHCGEVKVRVGWLAGLQLFLKPGLWYASNIAHGQIMQGPPKTGSSHNPSRDGHSQERTASWCVVLSSPLCRTTGGSSCLGQHTLLQLCVQGFGWMDGWMDAVPYLMGHGIFGARVRCTMWHANG
jgi:hypothetical protein